MHRGDPRQGPTVGVKVETQRQSQVLVYKAVTKAGAWNYRHGFRVGACIRDGPLSTGTGPRNLEPDARGGAGARGGAPFVGQNLELLTKS